MFALVTLPWVPSSRKVDSRHCVLCLDDGYQDGIHDLLLGHNLIQAIFFPGYHADRTGPYPDYPVKITQKICFWDLTAFSKLFYEENKE